MPQPRLSMNRYLLTLLSLAVAINSCGINDSILYSELIGEWRCVKKGFICSELGDEDCEENTNCEWGLQFYPISEWICLDSNPGGMQSCLGEFLSIRSEQTFLKNNESGDSETMEFAGVWERDAHDNEVTFTYQEISESLSFEYTVSDTLILEQTHPSNPAYREVWVRYDN